MGSLRNFIGEHLIGLKIQRVNAYNFVGGGHNLTKLYQVMWLVALVITWTLILEGVPPTKFEMLHI